MLRLLFFLLALSLSAKVKPDPSRWQAWLEPDTRSFTSTVDARDGFKDNLVPRGLVLPLEDQHYACFDIDLLRVAALWRADSAEVPFDYAGMAVYSYPDIRRKVMAGQKNLPRPIGPRLLESPRIPGVSIGDPRLSDPRPLTDGADDTGRGRLPDGRFLGIDFSRGVALDYRIGDTVLRERIGASWRQWAVAAHSQPISILLGKIADSATLSGPCELRKEGELSFAYLPPAAAQTQVTLRLQPGAIPEPQPAATRWPEPITAGVAKSADFSQLAVDYLAFPEGDRAVRPSSIDFFADGRAAIVTFDGDVWIVSNIATSPSWKRFASGLHEPLSIGVRGEEIFVFDRSGFWRLDDRNGDGEADYHTLFCAEILQSAETREMAKTMVVQNDGSFVIGKPGQTGSTSHRQSGSIMRISPDGSQLRRLAYGFRHPMLGYDPGTGDITSSDQQGNYVPSTPFHLLTPDVVTYHGHLPGHAKAESYPGAITPPPVWVQHRVCGSGAGIVTTRSSQMGPLADRHLMLSFTPPTLVDVFHDGEQGGANKLPLKLDLAPFNGAVNPQDGLLYVVGFIVWGSVAKDTAGLARVRPHGEAAWPLPASARATRRGILLRYATAQEATLDDFVVKRWNYRRSKAYGSAHYRLDGKKGEDELAISSITFSADRKQIFLGVPDMVESMQIRVMRETQETYLTAHRLTGIDLSKEGFASNEVDLAPTALAKSADVPASKDLGESLYTQLGCIACHSTDGSTLGRTGPSWKGLFGSTRDIIGGAAVKADEAYLRESILDPAAKVAKGAVNGEAGMPIYAGILSASQIDSLIVYIQSLK